MRCRGGADTDAKSAMCLEVQDTCGGAGAQGEGAGEIEVLLHSQALFKEYLL